MEQLNSVTLRGIIGNARIQNIGDTDSNGVERTVTEILASQVSVIGGTLQ